MPKNLVIPHYNYITNRKAYNEKHGYLPSIIIVIDLTIAFFNKVVKRLSYILEIPL